MKTEKIYSLPIKEENFINAISTEYAHPRGSNIQYAVDFPLATGTPILAAQDGKVIIVKMASNEGGEGQKFKDNPEKYLNSIYIQHAENEFSKYSHLSYLSQTVSVGDIVVKGQVIALSGNTGYSSGPHLHFHVMRRTLINPKNPGDWETMEIQWDKPFIILRK